MAFKAYFDGGNEADSTRYTVVTLAGVSGDQLHWKEFNKQWNKVLLDHGAPWLHTTDALTLNREFAIEKGWTPLKISAFISDCVSVLERCCATQDRINLINYNGLRPVTVSINLHDFLRALRVIPDLGTPDNVCAIQCASLALVYGMEIHKATRFEFYFDRNEPFYGHVRDRVNNRKSRRSGTDWQKVVHMGESDMRNVPALQAADLFAWSVNRQIQDRVTKYEWQKRLLSIKREHEYYRYDRLTQPIMENIERVKSFNLPRRRPPR